MISLDSALRRHASSYPERTAIFFGGDKISYSQLLARADGLASFLCRKGIQRGDRVALLMKNSPAFIELAIAVSSIGAILLPLNFRLSAEEAKYIVDHAGTRFIFMDEELSTQHQFPIPCQIVDERGQADSSTFSLDGNQTTALRDRFQATDIFRLMYTSGTTDRPKGVIHTYGNFFWKTLDHAIVLGLSKDDRLLICGPLYHVGAFDLPGLGVLLFGGGICLQRDFNPTAVLDAVARLRVTSVWMAPAMLNRVLAEPRDELDLTSLRWCVGGGERTPEARIRQFTEVFPNARYIDSYGLTETCSGDTFMPEGSEIKKIGSVGTAVPNVAISIRNEAGAELAPGTEGEICIAGPKVTPGYWSDPGRTEASFFGPWFRTGDVGRMDEEGFLTLTDRKKDMIISGGENIASSEIERVIYMLPEIDEVAVIGIPDEKWGERPVAVAVLHPGMRLSEEALISHCSAHLARFKLPTGLFIRAELPRNASGKIIKRQIRDEILSSDLITRS